MLLSEKEMVFVFGLPLQSRFKIMKLYERCVLFLVVSVKKLYCIDITLWLSETKKIMDRSSLKFSFIIIKP